MLLGVAAIVSVSTGVLRPALTSLISQVARPDEQGGVLGLTQSLQALASIAAPAIAGLLINHGLLAAWAWLAAASLLAGFLVWKPVSVERREVREPARAAR
ncbi:MAG: hypothetical protein H7039_22530 [Bryobacteraceae bacterium]|nr:hypothetical protein [Bryobacteraceae bacterium]